MKVGQLDKYVTDLKNLKLNENYEELNKIIVDLENKITINKQNIEISKFFLIILKKFILFLIANTTIEELKKKNEKLEQDLEQMSFKVQDFNIYDIFKSGVSDGGSADASIILIQNLEKKLFKKFEFIDEKIRKTEEESNRFKNEFSINKNNLGTINKTLNLLKEEVEKNIKNGTLTNEILMEKHQELENKLKDVKTHLEDDLLTQINELKNSKKNQEEIQEYNNEEMNRTSANNKGNGNQNSFNLNTNNNFYNTTDQENNTSVGEKNIIGGNQNLIKTPTTVLSEAEIKQVRECIKKTSELEKTFKIFVNSINVDSIKNGIAKVNDGLMNRLTQNDILDIKDNISKKNFIFYPFFI